MEDNYLMPTYKRLPIVFERGEGIYMYDSHGEKYVDCISGIGVTNLGHSHPEVTQAIQAQAERLIHTSNLYVVEAQQALAQRLVQISGMTNAFIGNSGTEANECAIKLARLYGHQKNIDCPNIIVMEGAFHGRTLAALSASSSAKIQSGFEPLVEGFVRVPFNDTEAVKRIATQNPNIVAIFVEPIQGEGGVRIPAPQYLSELRAICDEQQWLLMLDEVQCGNGRTGNYFAFQHSGIIPDVVTTAKGLANGFPIGACLAHGAAANLFRPGHHGTTFGGNPLACQTALKVIEVLHRDDHINNAQKMGKLMLDLIKHQLDGAEYVADIRGKGLMIGIELTGPCAELVALARTKGLMINVTSESVIRLLPPLIIDEAQARSISELLCKLIKTYAGDDRSVPRSQAS